MLDVPAVAGSAPVSTLMRTSPLPADEEPASAAAAVEVIGKHPLERAPSDDNVPKDATPTSSIDMAAVLRPPVTTNSGSQQRNG